MRARLLSCDVLQVLISDYVGEEKSGKWLFAGVYTDDIQVYRRAWHPIVVTTWIRPRQRTFQVETRIVDPAGNAFATQVVGVNIDRQDIPDRARLLLPFHLAEGPAVDGLFRVAMREGDQGDFAEIHSFQMTIIDEPTAQRH